VINTKYFRHEDGEYFVTSDVDVVLVAERKICSGFIPENWGHPIEYPNPGWKEISPPDAGPIEERYINATDRPSLKEKK